MKILEIDMRIGYIKHAKFLTSLAPCTGISRLTITPVGCRQTNTSTSMEAGYADTIVDTCNS